MEVNVIPAVGLVLTILGFTLLMLFVAVLFFAVFMVWKGMKESKQYKNVVLPGVMSSESNSNTIDEDSIESIDLDSFAMQEETKDKTALEAVQSGPVMPMPMPIPAPEVNMTGTNGGSNNDGTQDGPTTGPDLNVSDDGADLLDPTVDPIGMGGSHADDTDGGPASETGAPGFHVREEDRGTGVDSMMTALDGFSSSMAMPSLDVPSLDRTEDGLPSPSNDGASSNPFRPVM